MFSWFHQFKSSPKSAIGDEAEGRHRDGAETAPTGLSNGSVSGDSPIRSPEHDAFGIDPFAKAIAKSIATSNASDGIVYALNGAWGSGKSSVINLILYHLEEEISNRKIVPLAFNPWWFSGTEALTLSFFQEMTATIGQSLGDKAKETLARLGSRISTAGPLLGGIAALVTSNPVAAGAVSGGATLIEKLTRLDSTVEKDHRKLSEILLANQRRFLVVIDDIDRLGTDEALQIFKLVKSVGRLPNVIYLMAFDRHLAERMISERFPAEGVSYLEKVIQGGFDLPMPDADDLRSQLLMDLEKTIGAPPEEKMQRFWNLFYDIVAPLLVTPRDIIRLGNAVKVVWPAVENDVDRADLLSIETIRLFLPSVYQAIRDHPDMLTGSQSKEGRNKDDLVAEYNAIFLDGLSSRRSEIAKRSLRRLFPRLDAVWSNTWHGNPEKWHRDRLLCSSVHFKTYFSFGVVDDGITSLESDSMVASAGIAGATAAALHKYAMSPRRKKGSRASLALEELSVRASDIRENDIPQFLSDIFAIADALDIDSDKVRGFGFGSNQLRIHWLLNNLLFDRFSLDKRTKLIEHAARSSSLGWIVSLSSRCKDIKNRSKKDEVTHDENLIDDNSVERLFEYSLERLRSAARDGSLLKARNLIYLLYRWKDRAGSEEVKNWSSENLNSDEFIALVTADAIQESWSHGMGSFDYMGDRVARRSEYVHLDALRSLFDVDRLRDRAAEMQNSANTNPDHRTAVTRFLEAPDRDPEHGR